MTIEHGSGSPCPLCGGALEGSRAMIPFVLRGTVAVIKDVPAEVCQSCGEAYMHAAATDDVTALLRTARDAGAEVVVMTYRSHHAAA